MMADCKCPKCSHEWEDCGLVTQAEFEEMESELESRLEDAKDRDAEQNLEDFKAGFGFDGKDVYLNGKFLFSVSPHGNTGLELADFLYKHGRDQHFCEQRTKAETLKEYANA